MLIAKSSDFPVITASRGNGRSGWVGWRGWRGWSADLLLNTAAELLRVGDHHEGLWGTAGAANYDRAVAQHAPPEGFLDADAFDAGKHQIERAAAAEPGFDEHPPVGYRHFGSVALGQ